ncbi:OpgC family protein [Jannaschia ovalis]|uniref:OpgC domain-containing protein n=1 Tax=Jannaschia ovalis TaxID=3038773 RepID=A0ABY8LDF3_9RHOB|nr:OpgC domain-containing protein [Jannaschia sp. GRR-S6-38]WGH78632.1 OpgC domain-containing protein [Jannaschia sp. GRR-S6-38]
MATTTPSRAYQSAPRATTATAGAAIRDLRLDVFRGLAMFIILLAHTPGNAWTLWIPARWGFSDATEIFVFCSGMASAIAFGRSFDRMGWRLGTARVGFRVWQIYWAHICMFLAIATMLAAIDAAAWNPSETYIGTLNLWKFFADPAPQLIGLLTLTYVPNYFDILPMYMAVLVMMPAMVALARVSLPLTFALSLTIWVFAQGALLDTLGLGHLHLAFPAEPWSDRAWFFNPFGWQLVFFTGFAFMRGWIPAPPVRPWLIGLALAVVLVSMVLSSIGFRLFQTDLVKGAYVALTGCAETGFGACNPVLDWRQAHRDWFDKSDFAILHYVHFLALAYLAWSAAGAGGARLVAAGQGAVARLWNGLIRLITKVGQQSLAVFVFSMVLARVNGIVLDLIGRNAGTWALVNLTGFALLIACAYTAGWFKSQPWRAKR